MYDEHESCCTSSSSTHFQYNIAIIKMKPYGFCSAAFYQSVKDKKNRFILSCVLCDHDRDLVYAILKLRIFTQRNVSGIL